MNYFSETPLTTCRNVAQSLHKLYEHTLIIPERKILQQLKTPQPDPTML